jgi:hypothetical protein
MKGSQVWLPFFVFIKLIAGHYRMVLLKLTFMFVYTIITHTVPNSKPLNLIL